MNKLSRTTKTYHVWYNMVWRCNKTDGHFYRFYGKRGIKVCDRWLSYDNFYKDMGEKPDKMSLERIDNDKGYYPENCRWASQLEQTQNRRNTRLITIDGETKSASEWVRSVSDSQTVWWRLRKTLQTRGSDEFAKRIKSLQVN